MARITLDDLNKGVDNKFGDFELEGFNVDSEGNPLIDSEDSAVILRFRHYLRTDKETRARLRKAFEMAEEQDSAKLAEYFGEDADVTSALVMHIKAVIRPLAVEPEHADILEAALGEDPVKWIYILNEYARHVGADSGESGPSNS